MRNFNFVLIIITVIMTGINGYSSVISDTARHISKRAEKNRDKSLLLIENGKAKSTIVIPGKATNREKALALDMQRLLHKMSGCMLEIVTESTNLNGNFIQIGKTSTLS